MQALAIALSLCFSPPAASGAGEDAKAEAPPVQQPAEAETETEVGPEGEGAADEAASPEPEPALPAQVAVSLRPRVAGTYTILAGDGEAVLEEAALGPEAPRTVQLDAGAVYYVHGPDGRSRAIVVVDSGSPLIWDGERTLPELAWEAAVAEELAVAEAEARAEAEERARLEAAMQAQPGEARKKRRNWRAWASPLASTFVPGTGQFINGQGGKGTGLLFGTVASLGGAIALYNIPSDGTRPLGAEYARLVGFGLLSTAVPVLWIYAIADAHKVAVNKEVTPVLEHKVRVSVSRSMTVGFRADASRPAFYDDWGVAIMGQPVRRFSVGVSDLGVKFGEASDPQIWQFGLRADYRVFDRKRVWIDLGVGVAMQVAVTGPRGGLDPEAAVPRPRARFGAIPYGQLDFRFFVLDRLSLDLKPRLSVPVTTRYFSANRALPRYAPTLELGAGVAAYF